MKQTADKKHSIDGKLNFQEITWDLFERWRIILLSALIVMVLVSGIGIARDMKVARDAQSAKSNKKDTTVQSLIESLPEHEQDLVLSAYSMVEEREEVKKYIKTSPLMNTNPYDHTRFRTRWAINAEYELKTTLVQAYAAALQEKKSLATIIEKCNLDMSVDQLNDLVIVRYATEQGNGLLSCDILLYGDMDPADLNQALASVIQSATAKLNKDVGEHTITTLSAEEVEVNDSEVAQKHTTVFNNLYNTTTQLNNLVNTFTPRQKDIYYQAIALGQETEDVQPFELSIKAIAKRLVMGFLVGFVLFGILYAARIILTRRIMFPDELEEAGVRLLDEWYDEPKRKPFYRQSPDPTVFKKHHLRKLNRENSLKTVLETIETIAKKDNLSNIIMVLTAKLTRNQTDYLEQMKSQLQSCGISMSVAKQNHKQGERVYDKGILEADSVLVIAVQNETMIGDLNEVLKKKNYYSTPLIGSIFFG